MILVLIWSAKGEGRVSRDPKVGDDGKYKESMYTLYITRAVVLTGIRRRRGSQDVHM